MVHAGVCDDRMWDGVVAELGEGHAIVRHELRGFGDTPPPAQGCYSDAEDLASALDGPVVLVGASYGGQVCLELAAARPELVRGLVLLAAPLPDHEWSPKVEAYAKEEDRLLEARELDGATELNVAFWAGAAEPAVQRAVRGMQRRAFELQLASSAEAIEPSPINLAAVSAPALVATGDRDIEDFQRIAARLTEALPNARRVSIEGAGHLPALERPRETAALLDDFLEDLRGV